MKNEFTIRVSAPECEEEHQKGFPMQTRVTGVGKLGVEAAKAIENEWKLMALLVPLEKTDGVDSINSPDMMFTVLSQCDMADRERAVFEIAQNKGQHRLNVVLNIDRTLDSSLLTDKADAVFDLTAYEGEKAVDVACSAVKAVFSLIYGNGLVKNDYQYVFCLLRSTGICYVGKIIFPDQDYEKPPKLYFEKNPQLAKARKMLYVIYYEKDGDLKGLELIANMIYGLSNPDVETGYQIIIGEHRSTRAVVIHTGVD